MRALSGSCSTFETMLESGSIVVIDWRDALPESGEPNKQRPAIVVGRNEVFHES